jgi:hypothetical protein
MKKTFKILGYLFLLIIASLIILININLQTGSNLQNNADTKKDVILQLNYLENQLKHQEAGHKMQEIFPEGFIFINTLYGLSWAEIANTENKSSQLFSRSVTEAKYAYREINSSQAKSNFDTGLNPAYGIFYSGWKNYLLSKILSVENKKDSVEILEFKTNCKQIADAVQSNPSPFLESYSNSCWPADMFAAIASLKMHDKLFDVKYDTIIKNWLDKVKSKTDPETKLIPHAAMVGSGDICQEPRGSSTALMILLLTEIDSAFAQQQFNIFYSQFTITRFGFPAIREFPENKPGKGDIDSGPVILNISFPATIVSIGVFKKFGYTHMADKISKCVDAFGFPYTTKTEKKYLFGKIPIADAFIAWSRIQPAVKTITAENQKNQYDFGSFIYFRIFSLLIIIIIILLPFTKTLLRKFKKPSNSLTP